MSANGRIRKILDDGVEIEYSKEDSCHQNVFEKSKIKYNNGPAPVKLIKEDMPIFVDLNAGKISDVFIIVDLNLSVYYGKIEKHLSENKLLIGIGAYSFSVSLDDFSTNDSNLLTSSGDWQGLWIQVYSTNERNILEARVFKKEDTLLVKLKEFNRNSQGVEETEYFVFKDKNSLSHYLHKSSVFYRNLSANVEASHAKTIIGVNSEIFIFDGKIVAEVSSNPIGYPSEEHIGNNSYIPSFALPEPGNNVPVRDERGLDAVNSPNYNKNCYNKNVHENDGLFCFTKFKNLNIKAQRKLSGLQLNSENFYVNECVFKYRAEMKVQCAVLIGILEHYCRNFYSYVDLPFIRDIEQVLSSNEMSSYFQLISLVEELIRSNEETDYKLACLYEYIFKNFAFFNHLSSWVLNSNIDYYELSNKYYIVFEVYLKVEEGIHKNIHRPLIYDSENNKLRIILYTDCWTSLNLYDDYQMILDGFFSVQYPVNLNQRYLKNDFNFDSFIMKSLDLINSKSKLDILEHYDNHIEILRNRYNEGHEERVIDCYDQAIAKRREYLKSIINS